jgi:hypothetical protein
MAIKKATELKLHPEGFELECTTVWAFARLTVEVVDSLDKSKGLINPSQEKSFLIKNYRMDEIYEPILVDSSIPKVSLRNQRRKNKKKVKYKNKKL